MPNEIEKELRVKLEDIIILSEGLIKLSQEIYTLFKEERKNGK